MGENKHNRAIVIANSIYLLVGIFCQICAYINCNGHYNNYFKYVIMIVGVRIGFRVLDFENTQEILGRDTFNILI